MNGTRELSTSRVQELLEIKEKLGFKGESPKGISCPENQNACVNDKQAISNLSEEHINTIVSRVSEAVLQRLNAQK